MCGLNKLLLVVVIIFVPSCAYNEKIKYSLKEKYSFLETDNAKRHWGTIDGEVVGNSEAEFTKCLNSLNDEGKSNSWLIERKLLRCMERKGLFFIDEKVIVNDS